MKSETPSQILFPESSKQLLSQCAPTQDTISIKFFDFEPDTPYNQLFAAFNKITKNLVEGNLVQVVFKSPGGKLLQFESFAADEKAVRKFTALLVVLATILENMREGKITTKRDIYYQQVNLFKNTQKSTDYLLDLIVSNLNVGLSVLNLCPNQKGLMYHRGLEVPGLIPVDFQEVERYNYSSVVVIEKEAVFRSFVNHVQKYSLFQNTVFVTGLGFPDVLTRMFVKSLNVPVMAFMDSDIYGMLIYNTYKNSSARTTVTDTTPASFLADDKVKPAVTSVNDHSSFNFLGCFLLDYKSGYMNIAKRDIRIMINALSTIDEPSLKREIQRGLMLYKKAEMNVANREHHNVIEYIVHKVSTKLQERESDQLMS